MATTKSSPKELAVKADVLTLNIDYSSAVISETLTLAFVAKLEGGAYRRDITCTFLTDAAANVVLTVAGTTIETMAVLSPKRYIVECSLVGAALGGMALTKVFNVTDSSVETYLSVTAPALYSAMTATDHTVALSGTPLQDSDTYGSISVAF